MCIKPSGVLDFNDTAAFIVTSDRLIVTTEAALDLGAGSDYVQESVA
ncbi:MAG TPA: hypothetical protein QF564_22040 [Pirellulaceae bacterium]|nr:hypothetical protein [Pirellulaceae bacterium]